MASSESNSAVGRFSGATGFTLIELVIVIVVIGILSGVGARIGGQVLDAARVDETREELERLAFAVAGDPRLKNNGVRSDFGYVGDVGAMPASLTDLYTNPGSYSTWKGPYIQNTLEQVTDDYKRDAWATAYAYTGGVTITSSGSGSNLIRNIASSTDDLLYNSVSGNITDLNGSPPDTIYRDSISVNLTFPNGTGGTTTKSATVGAGGYFLLDSIPVGNHTLEIVYSPTTDTIRRYVAVTANSSAYGQYALLSDHWVESAGGGGTVKLLNSWVSDNTYATQDAAFAVSAGTDRIVLVYLSAEKNGSGPMAVTSVSLGDQVLTEVYDFNAGAPTGYHHLNWVGYLLESEIAARVGDTLTITYSNAPGNPFDEPKIHYASYENVDQTTPIADSANNTSSSAASLTLSGTITAGLNDKIVAFNVSGQHFALSISTAGYSERTEEIGVTDGHSSAAYDRPATTAVTENITFTVATATRMAVSALVLNAN